jgi:hypothetical protein
MWLTLDLRTSYKCLINFFSPSNVDIIDSYFYMSFLNVYYITICKLNEKNLILNEIKNWQVCYSGLVTLVVVHYIVDLPIGHCNIGNQIVGKWKVVKKFALGCPSSRKLEIWLLNHVRTNWCLWKNIMEQMKVYFEPRWFQLWTFQELDEWHDFELLKHIT